MPGEKPAIKTNTSASVLPSDANSWARAELHTQEPQDINQALLLIYRRASVRGHCVHPLLDGSFNDCRIRPISFSHSQPIDTNPWTTVPQLFIRHKTKIWTATILKLHFCRQLSYMTQGVPTTGALCLSVRKPFYENAEIAVTHIIKKRATWSKRVKIVCWASRSFPVLGSRSRIIISEVNTHPERCLCVVDRECFRSDLLVDPCYGRLGPEEVVLDVAGKFFWCHNISINHISQFSWEQEKWESLEQCRLIPSSYWRVRFLTYLDVLL